MAQTINMDGWMDGSGIGVLEIEDGMISDLEPWAEGGMEIAQGDDVDEDEAYFLEDGEEDEDSDGDSDYDDDFEDEDSEEVDDDFDSDDDDF